MSQWCPYIHVAHFKFECSLRGGGGPGRGGRVCMKDSRIGNLRNTIPSRPDRVKAGTVVGKMCGSGPMCSRLH
jgi:hypothetical protein